MKTNNSTIVSSNTPSEFRPSTARSTATAYDFNRDHRKVVLLTQALVVGAFVAIFSLSVSIISYKAITTGENSTLHLAERWREEAVLKLAGFVADEFEEASALSKLPYMLCSSLDLSQEGDRHKAAELLGQVTTATEYTFFAVMSEAVAGGVMVATFNHPYLDQISLLVYENSALFFYADYSAFVRGEAPTANYANASNVVESSLWPGYLSALGEGATGSEFSYWTPVIFNAARQQYSIFNVALGSDPNLYSFGSLVGVDAYFVQSYLQQATVGLLGEKETLSTVFDMNGCLFGFDDNTLEAEINGEEGNGEEEEEEEWEEAFWQMMLEERFILGNCSKAIDEQNKVEMYLNKFMHAGVMDSDDPVIHFEADIDGRDFLISFGLIAVGADDDDDDEEEEEEKASKEEEEPTNPILPIGTDGFYVVTAIEYFMLVGVVVARDEVLRKMDDGTMDVIVWACVLGLIGIAIWCALSSLLTRPLKSNLKTEATRRHLVSVENSRLRALAAKDAVADPHLDTETPLTRVRELMETLQAATPSPQLAEAINILRRIDTHELNAIQWHTQLKGRVDDELESWMRQTFQGGDSPQPQPQPLPPPYPAPAGRPLLTATPRAQGSVTVLPSGHSPRPVVDTMVEMEVVSTSTPTPTHTGPVAEDSIVKAEKERSLASPYSPMDLPDAEAGADLGPGGQSQENDSCAYVRAQMGPRVWELLQTYDRFGYSALQLDEIAHSCPLHTTALFLCQQCGLFEALPLDPRTASALFSALEREYRHVPYHNAIHAAEVLSLGVALVQDSVLNPHMGAVHTLALILACAGHDLQHPAVNNNFLISTAHPHAITFSDDAVLERHHLACLFGILNTPGCNILRHFSRENRALVRKIVIKMILSTDMAAHFEHVGSFTTKAANGVYGLETHTNPSFDDSTDLNHSFLSENHAPSRQGTHRSYSQHSQGKSRSRAPSHTALNTSTRAPLPLDHLITGLCTAIKLADIGHTAKGMPAAAQWTLRVNLEFFAQGQAERAAGLPVSQFMDYETRNIPKSQVGFIRFVVQPLAEAWAQICPVPLDTSGLARRYSSQSLFPSLHPSPESYGFGPTTQAELHSENGGEMDHFGGHSLVFALKRNCNYWASLQNRGVVDVELPDGTPLPFPPEWSRTAAHALDSNLRFSPSAHLGDKCVRYHNRRSSEYSLPLSNRSGAPPPSFSASIRLSDLTTFPTSLAHNGSEERLSGGGSPTTLVHHPQPKPTHSIHSLSHQSPSPEPTPLRHDFYTRSISTHRLATLASSPPSPSPLPASPSSSSSHRS
eukprot:GCRY01001061.1.p1 GENE.GCRY01001061.1~~GCRY01001061.1.p1  ORF type:complete len:1295 (+),score=385.99 GCRY01001061.1:210-4094(+)